MLSMATITLDLFGNLLHTIDFLTTQCQVQLVKLCSFLSFGYKLLVEWNSIIENVKNFGRKNAIILYFFQKYFAHFTGIFEAMIFHKKWRKQCNICLFYNSICYIKSLKIIHFSRSKVNNLWFDIIFGTLFFLR